MPRPRPIARQLEFAAGAGVVSELAADVGVSERHLQRRWGTAFGYGPKTLHQVLRFQHTHCDWHAPAGVWPMWPPLSATRTRLT